MQEYLEYSYSKRQVNLPHPMNRPFLETTSRS
jgi:hypothetical protein